MRQMKHVYRFWFEDLNGEDRLENLAVSDRIILKYRLSKCGTRMVTEFVWLGEGPVAVFCEHGDEHFVCVRVGIS
jgi:hypothetical protein